MASKAQSIIRNNSTLEACEEEAARICMSRQEVDGWTCIYTFDDGSKLQRQFMPAACEESSYIKVIA